MSSDQLETELVNKITELQQEAKEHQLVLDAFETVEPTRKCFRMIGGVLVERTVQDIKPSLEENLVNIDKVISNLTETVNQRRQERTNNGKSVPTRESATKPKDNNSKQSNGTVGVLA